MENEETIDLLDYLQRLLKHWIPATVVAALVLAAGLVLGMRGGEGRTEELSAKAHVMMQPSDAKDAADADLQAQLSAQWMRTFVALEDLPAIVDPVVTKLGGDSTPEDIAARTSIYWGGGSMLLAVKATADNEQEAITMANTAAQALVDSAPSIVKLPKDQVPTMVVVEPAKIVEDDETTAANASGGWLLPTVGAALALWFVTAYVLEALQARRARRGSVSTAAR